MHKKGLLICFQDIWPKLKPIFSWKTLAFTLTFNAVNFKTKPNKDITTENAVKDLEKNKPCTSKSKPPTDNLSKSERKALKELQPDTLTVILVAGKGRSTVFLNCKDYLEKCMDHICNGPYQLLKKRTYYLNQS